MLISDALDAYAAQVPVVTQMIYHMLHICNTDWQ